MSLLKGIPKKEVREFSHAMIMYKDLRDGLVYEYALSGRLSDIGMLNDDDGPSYVNVVILPDEELAGEASVKYRVPIEEARSSPAEMQHRLYFPYKHIRKVSGAVAKAAFDYWDKQNSWDQ